MKKSIIITILFLASSLSVAQTDLGLSQMNDSDKNKTGLYKLSDSELKSLETWLIKQQKTINKTEKQTNAGFESKKEAERNDVVTTLEKHYKDTLGNTYYKLNNGQVWKQVQGGSLILSNDGTQNITIEPQIMGSWMLKGDGNRGVKVKRIR